MKSFGLALRDAHLELARQIEASGELPSPELLDHDYRAILMSGAEKCPVVDGAVAGATHLKPLDLALPQDILSRPDLGEQRHLLPARTILLQLWRNRNPFIRGIDLRYRGQPQQAIGHDIDSFYYAVGYPDTPPYLVNSVVAEMANLAHMSADDPSVSGAVRTTTHDSVIGAYGIDALYYLTDRECSAIARAAGSIVIAAEAYTLRDERP